MYYISTKSVEVSCCFPYDENTQDYYYYYSGDDQNTLIYPDILY